ncbi:hypothetical protein D0869_12789 [Hortaea werneckii]|uniref:Uncharacterized protein n=1 Tax=Hortaea werneckii TaxID=91943 RepID=A0A3M6W6Y1_HORWE|nr:hypothetical protein D0869_12789 [Hortaea werneckii]
MQRCPSITQQDRENVLFQVQTGEKRSPLQSKHVNHNDLGKPVGQNEPLPSTGLPFQAQPPTVPLPPQPEVSQQLPFHVDGPVDHNMSPMLNQDRRESALGMLAEVSRRHLDLRECELSQHQHQQQQRQANPLGGQQVAEQALLLQQFQQAQEQAQTAKAYQNFSASPSKPEYVPRRIAAPVPPKGGERMDFTTVPSEHLDPSGLNINVKLPAQSSRQAQSHQQISQSQPSSENLDPQLQPQTSNFIPANVPNSLDEFMVWNPTTTTSHAVFGMLHDPSDQSNRQSFGLLGKNVRKPQRGRFSNSRREEVSKIRKQGACIRCRMLKKPCSEGTPCQTCANVESARLWKGTCLRTKLIDEFTLWSTNLFRARAQIETMAAIQGLQPTSLHGRLEMRCFRGSNLGMSFLVKQYADSDPLLGLQSSTAGSDDHPSDSLWLVDERDFLAKLESYLDRIMSNWVEGETSNFYKATLLTALDLAQEEEASKANASHLAGATSSATNAASNSSPAARSCYNLQDSLLKNVLELWLATTLLSRAENEMVETRYNADRSPLNEPESLDWTGSDKSANTEALSPASAKLVRRQLLAALEGRCEKLGKSVINEIERRLLQRAQVSRFSTFLSSVLLLSAVERTSSLYQNFATELEAQNNSPTSWPLETPPSRLWIQGPHFADLLIMLLRMRALPPQTKESLNGKLVVEKDSTYPANMTGKIASRDQIEEQVRAAAEWLDGIGLELAEIKRAVQEGVGSDLCLVGKVLLPMKVDSQ